MTSALAIQGRAPPCRRSLSQQLLVAATMGVSLTALYMFNGVQEAAKADLALSDFDMSLVQGVAVAIPLAVCGVPVGLLVDRVNRVRVLIAMTLLWVVAALGTAWAPSLALLFCARVLAAAAASAMLTTAVSLASDLSPPEHRGQAMQVMNLGKLVGSAAALPAGALLVTVFAAEYISWTGGLKPWRAAHVALAAFGVALSTLLLFLREPVRREVAAGLNAPVRVVLLEIWRRRAYLGPLLLGQCGILMADAAATIWATPILTRRFHLDPLQFAGWLGLGGLGAGLLGSVIGGWAADTGLRSGKPGGVMLGAVIASAVAVPAGLFAIMPGPITCLAALTLLLFCGTIASIALMALIGAYLPNETRGLAFGGFLAVGGLVGFGVAPPMVVLVSDGLGLRKLETAGGTRTPILEPSRLSPTPPNSLFLETRL
jgi:MFS family permease